MQNSWQQLTTADNHISKLRRSNGTSVSWARKSVSSYHWKRYSGRYDDEGNLRWWRSFWDNGDLHGVLVFSESEEGWEDEDVNCITVGDGYSSRRWRRADVDHLLATDVQESDENGELMLLIRWRQINKWRRRLGRYWRQWATLTAHRRRTDKDWDKTGSKGVYNNSTSHTRTKTEVE